MTCFLLNFFLLWLVIITEPVHIVTEDDIFLHRPTKYKSTTSTTTTSTTTTTTTTTTAKPTTTTTTRTTTTTPPPSSVKAYNTSYGLCYDCECPNHGKYSYQFCHVTNVPKPVLCSVTEGYSSYNEKCTGKCDRFCDYSHFYCEVEEEEFQPCSNVVYVPLPI